MGSLWQSRRSAWLAAVALDGRRQSRNLAIAIFGYFVLWTLILTLQRAALTIHFDSAEAYAWGQELAWGYGKHPPMSGAIAWAWFSLFPARDWAMYGLAMAVNSCTFALLWMLARRVVDRRRAMLATLLMMVYPILNFKGYKYNPDLALLPFVVLVVLVYTVAFERRTLWWGIALGLAGSAAVLTKYWGVWPLVGVACAALLHPDRSKFFRSPAPYAAVATFVVAMLPHLAWLISADFAPFYHAAMYTSLDQNRAPWQALTVSGHFIAMLLPVALAGAIAIGRNVSRQAAVGDAVRIDRAFHIWVVVAVMAVVPQMMAASLSIWMKSDWGIPLFTMVPLAIISLPRLAIPVRALSRVSALVVLFCASSLLIAPMFGFARAYTEPGTSMPMQMDELARIATKVWHDRFGGKVPAIAGEERYAAPITFYSADHPRLFMANVPRLSPWRDVKTLDSTGFLGVCEAASTSCLAQVSALRPSAERIVVTTERRQYGRVGPSDVWVLVLAPPQPTREADQ